MFGWSRAKCPVSAEIRRWIDDRLQWLVQRLGSETILEMETILPTEEYFPEPYQGLRSDVRTMLDQVCVYMTVDPATVDLEFYTKAESPGSSGMYSEHDGRTVVWLETGNLTDPTSVVSTLAHELCHAHLLGGEYIAPDEPDGERLTDLATIYFGMGIFTANASLRDRSYTLGRWHHFGISRQGYLGAAELAYALARYAWLRDEWKPGWARYLRQDVRTPFKTALALLLREDGGQSPECEEPDDDVTPESAPKNSASVTQATDEAVADEEEPDVVVTPEDQRFIEAMNALDDERWEEAIAGFSALLKGDREDSEAYEYRARAHLKLGHWSEAQADADRALQLDADAYDAYRTRGQARLARSQFAKAIADFTAYLDLLGSEFHHTHRMAIGYFLRGLAYARDGKPDRAIAELTAAINDAPNWPAPYRARAASFEALGKLEDAAADREAAAWQADAHGEGEEVF